MTTLTATPCDRVERDELVLRWRFLPRKIVRDLLRRRPDAHHVLTAMEFDDLEQVGLLCLLRAAGRWDRERGVRFSTFAFTYVLNGIRKEIFQRVSRRPPEASLACEPAAASEDGPSFEDLYAALARLGPADQEVLTQRFGLGGQPARTLESIARECGRTKECVRKRVNKAVGRLAEQMAGLR
jgi:RNA polymerase sigma factor (sigma-70 family)